MYKIIGGDGNEYGPVTAEQLRQWMTEGRINQNTQVQAEGSPEWRPLSTYPELTGATEAPTSSPGDPATTAVAQSDAVPGDYQLVIGDCVSRGWEVAKNNLGIVVGGTVLVFLAQVLIQLPGSIGQRLLEQGAAQPALLAVGLALTVLGGLAALILSGPITGGLYYPFIQLLRGIPVQIGDFFAGFKRGFVQLMLSQIVITLLLVACVIVPAMILAVGLATQFAGQSGVGIAVTIVGVVLLIPAVALAIYLAVGWFFALPLIIDRQMNFWPAMQLSRRQVRKHWWKVLGLGVVTSLIVLAGFLLCCVGALFSIPIALASVMAGYEVIFGGRTR